MSENSAFQPSRQLPIPAFPTDDDRRYGYSAAKMLRTAARDVALAPSTEAKIIAFREVATTLGKAVSDLWLPKNIVVHRLNQIADAHIRFGLGDDQIDRIISEAMEPTDPRLNAEVGRTPIGLPPAVSMNRELFQPRAASNSTDNAKGLSWPDVLPISSTLPPVEPFIPELLPAAIRDYIMDTADRQQAPPPTSRP